MCLYTVIARRLDVHATPGNINDQPVGKNKAVDNDNASCKPSDATTYPLKLITCFVCLVCLPATIAVAQDGEKIPRALLEGMAQQQYSVLCASQQFTQCMGFSSTECTDLAQAAVEQCLLPLPAEIDLQELDNAALESCPQQVFADAGFSEQMAGECFDKAIGDEEG